MSSTAGRAARYSSARFFSTVSSTRYATNSASSAEARLPYTVHRRPPKRRGWPSLAAAFFSSSPGITRPAGTRHASPPPSTSCEKASLYHTMLPPDTTTTGIARLAKVDCAFSPLPCRSFAMPHHRQHRHHHNKQHGFHRRQHARQDGARGAERQNGKVHGPDAFVQCASLPGTAHRRRAVTLPE